jgi:hypothetical protein
VTAQPMSIQGQVVRQTVDAGSKSERDAVVLKTASGRDYVLRKQGMAAFGDDGLEPLVGHSINAHGINVGSTLILRDWSPIE